jgi:hypothetical protein
MDICVYELHHTVPWAKMKQTCPVSYTYHFNYLILGRQLFFAMTELSSIWRSASHGSNSENCCLLDWRHMTEIQIQDENFLIIIWIMEDHHVIACTVKHALQMYFPANWRLWGAVPSYLGKCITLVYWYQILEKHAASNMLIPIYYWKPAVFLWNVSALLQAMIHNQRTQQSSQTSTKPQNSLLVHYNFMQILGTNSGQLYLSKD